MPIPRDATFFFSSAAASCSSRRTIELARSLTILAAAPRPRFSPEGVSIGSPFSHAPRLAARRRGKTSAYLCSGMQALGKAERQRLLAGIVARKRVGTQLELAKALAAAGLPGHAGDDLA